MKATRFEFRYRIWIGFAIYVLGFWAPWLRYGNDAGAVTTTWLELAGELAATHALALQSATVLVTALAIFFAAVGTAFRVWGTAYLGTGIVQSGAMHARAVVAAGPYRHLRNPLYLGSFLFALAVAILMPPTGAIFFLVASFVQILRLVLGEETFLASEQGEPYLAYKARVPRLLPSPVALVAASPVRAKWAQALVGESFPLAMTLCFAVLAWRYNAQLLTQALIICFGGSLIVRALIASKPETA
jgi:protein-S-isoprenylcysteine O-methyltransferase Ste14